MRDENKINELKRLSELAKADSFWTDPKIENLGNIIGIFRDMAGNIWKSDDETNPYYVMLRSINHDFCCMLRNLNIDYKAYNDDNILQNVTKVLKSYMDNVDGLVSGVYDKDKVVEGWLYYKSPKKACKFYSIFNEDNQQYRCLNVLTNEGQLEFVKSWVEKYKTKARTYYSKEWIEECSNDIENGNKIIGWQWYIEF
jgi:hypothetical protein